MKRLLCGLVTALLLAGAAQAQTVVLVRHAEKAAEPAADPALSSAGEARARALAEALAGRKISLILTSPLQRTILTAAPLKAASGAESRAVDLAQGGAAHVAQTAALAAAAPKDGVVVVVGHSNTVPEIAKALGHAAAKPIADCSYDTMTVIDLGSRPPAVEEKTYGARSTC